MAISTCPKCDNTNFEIVEHSPIGSNFKYMFIQCNQCGAVVSVTDYYNLGEMISEIKQRLGML